MKKFLLMLTLVGGGLFLNACDKDKDDNKAKDPAAYLIEYVGKPYSTLVADCEKAGYKKMTVDTSGDNIIGYEKNGVLIPVFLDNNNIIIMIGKAKETTFTTVDQVVNNLNATDKKILAQYNNLENKSYELGGPENSSTNFDTIDKLIAEVKNQSFGYYTNYALSYVVIYKDQPIEIQYAYSYDNETEKGGIIEGYSLLAQ